MNWNNLKKYQCPACAGPMKEINGTHFCQKEGCRYLISNGRLTEIINKKPTGYVEPDRTGWE